MNDNPTAEHVAAGGLGSRGERAYQHVRADILRGRLPVGTIVSDTQVAVELGMSKTPVRDGLKRLEQEGLLERGRRRQLVVKGFSAEHRREILDVREALEQLAVRRACRVMPIEEIDHLRLCLLRQRRAAQSGDEEAFIELDEEFHLLLARGARLPIVFRFLGSLGGFVRVIRLGTHRVDGYLPQVLLEHEAIVDAIERRDEEAASKALATHLHTVDYALGGGRMQAAASGPTDGLASSR